MNIIKSAVDSSEYKYIKMENKLKVILISNKNIDKSSAAITVNIGYNNDPPDVQGLAHFVEHMLFMGTEKYKQINYFHEFINQSGGQTNASTGTDETCFYFDISHDYFEKATEIFSYFFINPLFSDEALSKEMQAVDSEFKKNVPIEIIRKVAVLKEIMDNKSHPFYNFGVGNLNTLNKNDIKDRVREFYNKYYSADNMTLVLMSTLSIASLENLALKYYSLILNSRYTEKKNINEKNIFPFSVSKLIKIVPIAQEEELMVVWQLPNMDKYYKYKILEYISFLMGHESHGGIMYQLNSTNWVTSLTAGSIDNDNNFTLFGIVISLTSTGFKNIPIIINIINEYIDILKKDGINEKIYAEIKQLADITFTYKQLMAPIDLAPYVSKHMLCYKIQDVLYGPYKYNDITDKANKLLANCLNLLNKSNMLVIISANQYDESKDLITEKYYGTKYKYININNSTKYAEYGNEFNFKTKNKFNLHLPYKNPFLPIDVHLLAKKENNIKPKKLIDNSNLQIWYNMSTFKTPIIFISLLLYSDEFYKNPKNYILTEVFFDLLNKKLISELYYANLCNTGYDNSTNRDNIHIHFYGYPSNIETIIKLIVNTMFDFKFNEDTFKDTVNYFKNMLQNFKLGSSYIIAKDHLQGKFYDTNYSINDLSIALHNISIKDMDIIKKAFNNCSIKLYLYGNILDDNIIKITKLFDVFTHNKSIPIERKHYAVTELINGEQQLYINHSVNKISDNSVIIIFFEIGQIILGKTKNWDKIITLAMLINNLIKEKFFNKLRTEQQVGYIVASKLESITTTKGHIYGISFMVQSHTFDPNALRKLIKTFIKESYIDLSNVEQTLFNNFKNILAKNIMEKFISPKDEYDFYLKKILENDIIDYREILVMTLHKLTNDNLIDFYKTYFIDKNTRKIRIMELYSYNLLKNYK